MKLENVKLSELKPLENNVRKHNDIQINELIKSVEQFGQTRAIVIDEDNNILIGNGLYEALVKMGKKDAQCYRKTGLTEVQKKKLVLSDNKIYALGADNFDTIQDYINEITITGDFDIAGYDEFILKSMTATDKENEEAIASYGVVTDIKYTEPQETTPQVTNQPTQVTPEPQVENKTVTMVTEKSNTPDRKYVICPSCGEVIYID